LGVQSSANRTRVSGTFAPGVAVAALGVGVPETGAVARAGAAVLVGPAPVVAVGAASPHAASSSVAARAALLKIRVFAISSVLLLLIT
jgi:hypothetical protein